MRKQITLFVFIVLVMMVAFLKRMSVLESGQPALGRTNSETRKHNSGPKKVGEHPFKNMRADW